MKRFALIFIFLFIGCVHQPLSKPQTVVLENVRVHVVPDSTYFPANTNHLKAKGKLWGIATTTNEIYLVGKIVDGKIEVDAKIAGHELIHLLNFKDSRFKNPDH